MKFAIIRRYRLLMESMFLRRKPRTNPWLTSISQRRSLSAVGLGTAWRLMYDCRPRSSGRRRRAEASWERASHGVGGTPEVDRLSMRIYRVKCAASLQIPMAYMIWLAACLNGASRPSNTEKGECQFGGGAGANGIPVFCAFSIKCAQMFFTEVLMSDFVPQNSKGIERGVLSPLARIQSNCRNIWRGRFVGFHSGSSMVPVRVNSSNFDTG